jgi:hypothetical protein
MKSLLLFLVLLLMARLGKLEQRLCMPTAQTHTTSMEDVDAEVQKPKVGGNRFLDYLRKSRQAQQQAPVNQPALINSEDNAEDTDTPPARPQINKDHFLQRLRCLKQAKQQAHEQGEPTQPLTEQESA